MNKHNYRTKDNKIRYTITITDDGKNTLRALAQHRGVTIGDATEGAIAEAFGRIPSQSQNDLRKVFKIGVFKK